MTSENMELVRKSSWGNQYPTILKTPMATAIQGAKGSSKPPAQYIPVEDPNTLRSKARGRILDLLAHGPIVGLVNGLQSVYLDDTPLQNPDGTFNFSGVTVQTREGYPDQAYIPGFTAVENATEIAAEVKYATPIVRSVTNNDADAVIVTVAVQGLNQQQSNGDVTGYQVGFYIDVRNNGGAWVTTAGDTIAGKTMSTYQRSVRVPLNGTGPFDIRVRRATQEATETAKINDKLFWAIMTEVIDARLSYPDSALVAIDVDSELFGSKMPARSYDLKLSIIRVPSNYDPINRTYTGFWDGSFKMAWTDNPAWCFYDLSTHPTIGADNQDVDKWVLYRIAQYCDEMVPDGYGGMEPRFTCNTLFASREEAITTLNTLASVFRGMVYWGADSVVAVGDMPGDATKLVTPANVTSDGFEYVGTSLRERHSVAVVMWNDPTDNYKQIPELYEDPESIQLFGWRETQVTAACCTSRGQARRLAKWILYSERMETETVTYTATADHADLRPGDYIKVSDPDRAAARLGGRTKDATNKVITLDKAPAEANSGTWYLSCVMPSGVIQQREVQSFNGDVCTVKTVFPEVPLKGAVWVLSSAQVVTPMYRVTSVIEQDDGLTFQITATEHDPNKYAFVEFDLQLPDRPDSTIPSGPLAAPTHIVARSFKYIAGGTEHQGLTVSWRGVDDVRCNGYILEARDPNDVTYRTLYAGSGLSVDEKDIVDGEWLFRIKATTSTGRTSEWANVVINIAGLLLPAPPDSIEVSETTFEITLRPQSIYPGAMYEFWRSDVPLTMNMVESNARRIAINNELVDVGLKPKTTYYYYVRGTNIYGVSNFVGAQGTTLYNFEDILTALDEDIRKPGGLFEEMLDEAAQTTEEVKNAVDALKTDLKLSKMLEDIRDLATKTQLVGTATRNTVEEITRLSEDEALVARITTLKAQVDDDIVASLEEMQFAMAENNAAIAGQILTIKTQINDDIIAAMQVEQTARVDGDGALTLRLDTLSASTEDDIATVRQEITAQASYTDGAVARAVTTATVNGKSAVFGISVNGEVSEIGAIADRFYIYNPVGGSYTLAFAVVDGRTVIQDALIRDASIGMAKITEALQSDNYKPNEIGWRLTKAGVFEMNGNTPGQGSLVQTNQTITVSDELNTPRVILGKLPAVI